MYFSFEEYALDVINHVDNVCYSHLLLLGSKTLRTKYIRTSFCIYWKIIIKTMSLDLCLLKIYLL